jgi:hypothetical protein
VVLETAPNEPRTALRYLGGMSDHFRGIVTASGQPLFGQALLLLFSLPDK